MHNDSFCDSTSSESSSSVSSSSSGRFLPLPPFFLRPPAPAAEATTVATAAAIQVRFVQKILTAVNDVEHICLPRHLLLEERKIQISISQEVTVTENQLTDCCLVSTLCLGAPQHCLHGALPFLRWIVERLSRSLLSTSRVRNTCIRDEGNKSGDETINSRHAAVCLPTPPPPGSSRPDVCLFPLPPPCHNETDEGHLLRVREAQACMT